MSEQVKANIEQQHNQHELAGEHEKHAERIKEHREKAHEAAAESQESVEDLVAAAESHAIAGDEMLSNEDEASQAPALHSYGTQKALKADAFQKSMQRIRKSMSVPDRTLSKVVHNKTVEAASEVGAKTVARPSGILGGGIVTLFGSSFLLYMSKHYGFKYNYLAFLMLFIAGFFIGMLVELTLRSFIRNKQQD